MVSQPKLILVGFEPVLHHLLLDRLAADFAIAGAASTAAAALLLVRERSADVVLIDADSAGAGAADVISKLSLAGPAPIIALSASTAPAFLDATVLLAAGAQAVSHKPAGTLPLDLSDAFGNAVIALALQAAQP